MPTALDETDLRIIRLLQTDGRMSNVDIARTLGMSEATVRKRVDRLIAEKAVRVVALPDLGAIGCTLVVLITLRVDLSQIESIARALADLPEVRWVSHATGEYDLAVEAAFGSDEQLLQFLTTQLAAIPGIRNVSTAHVLRTIKSLADWRLPSAPPPTILIVDDDPDFVAMTRTVLESAGYRVLSAASGNEALAVMRRQHPSLVVLDVMMEGLLDGLDASRAMRLDANLQRVPIVMVSSISSSEYAGMFPTDEYIPVDVFLSKPVNPARLLEEVARLTQGR
ncbi:MAG: response regulator [Anaerolineae bacterium]|nr:response regulator [Anaerolineae bacterium]